MSIKEKYHQKILDGIRKKREQSQENTENKTPRDKAKYYFEGLKTKLGVKTVVEKVLLPFNNAFFDYHNKKVVSMNAELEIQKSRLKEFQAAIAENEQELADNTDPLLAKEAVIYHNEKKHLQKLANAIQNKIDKLSTKSQYHENHRVAFEGRRNQIAENASKKLLDHIAPFQHKLDGLKTREGDLKKNIKDFEAKIESFKKQRDEIQKSANKLRSATTQGKIAKLNQLIANSEKSLKKRQKEQFTIQRQIAKHNGYADSFKDIVRDLDRNTKIESIKAKTEEKEQPDTRYQPIFTTVTRPHWENYYDATEEESGGGEDNDAEEEDDENNFEDQEKEDLIDLLKEMRDRMAAMEQRQQVLEEENDKLKKELESEEEAKLSDADTINEMSVKIDQLTEDNKKLREQLESGMTGLPLKSPEAQNNPEQKISLMFAMNKLDNIVSLLNEENEKETFKMLLPFLKRTLLQKFGDDDSHGIKPLMSEVIDNLLGTIKSYDKAGTILFTNPTGVLVTTETNEFIAKIKEAINKTFSNT